MHRKLTAALVGLLALAALPAAGHDGESHADKSDKVLRRPVATPPASDGLSKEAKARQYFTDLPVVTQNGESMRFYSDVLKDQIVLVALFYTNCTGMCPLTNAKLAEVQDLLGDRMGRGVRFVSVTLEPEVDTPEVLKKYAANFEAGPGWLFLTGEKGDLSKITYRLGQTNSMIEAHNPFLMLGNVKKAHWAKLPPNLPSEAIATRLKLLAGANLGE